MVIAYTPSPSNRSDAVMAPQSQGSSFRITLPVQDLPSSPRTGRWRRSVFVSINL